MFKRVLVANRGEIARRVIRTLNQMGIESVAVYSEADEKAVYLKEATHALCIGPAPAKESYLCQDALLEAAIITDCEAIHPGFGFLSENAVFAERCARQKLTFIGPSPHLISVMGDKAKARQTMQDAGVKVLFGSDGLVRDSDHALKLAQKMGYPVLLKARAGGGGKGMRLVEEESALRDAFIEAEREAKSAFGDGELYLEKFVRNARHIEFQILADVYGNVVILGERECSIQRKNQKLIEEAPAVGFCEELRAKTTEILKTAMRKIGYVNAGTVEFLLDDAGNLYFMEMNTRIQVEHPVTELVYGVDIVEWQVRIACNEKLSLQNDALHPHGAAIECRINAEDARQNFLPTPGLIEDFIAPFNSPKGPVRIDTHVTKGFCVTPFYDSMLAKVITFGKDRNEALLLMKKTLEDLKIYGVQTTIDFHKAILMHADFKDGHYNCSFLQNNFSSLMASLTEN